MLESVGVMLLRKPVIVLLMASDDDCVFLCNSFIVFEEQRACTAIEPAV